LIISRNGTRKPAENANTRSPGDPGSKNDPMRRWRVPGPWLVSFSYRCN
jgi:hypothetical protein